MVLLVIAKGATKTWLGHILKIYEECIPLTNNSNFENASVINLHIYEFIMYKVLYQNTA